MLTISVLCPPTSTMVRGVSDAKIGSSQTASIPNRASSSAERTRTGIPASDAALKKSFTLFAIRAAIVANAIGSTFRLRAAAKARLSAFKQSAIASSQSDPVSCTFLPKPVTSLVSTSSCQASPCHSDTTSKRELEPTSITALLSPTRGTNAALRTRRRKGFPFGKVRCRTLRHSYG